MKRRNWFDWIGVGLFAGLMLLAFFIPMPANGQGLEIRNGTDVYHRAHPGTVEDGQKLSIGLADVLNAVIAAWRAEHADAGAKIKAIIEGNDSVVASLKQANAALGAVPGGLLAKTLAVGVYGAENPLGSLGGAYGGGGASITWNAFNLFTVTGRAGGAWSPQFHPEVSLAAEWWLF